LSRSSLRSACLNARGSDFDLQVGVFLADCLRGRIGRLVFQRVRLSVLRLLAGRELEAFAAHLLDITGMGKAVEVRAGEPFRSDPNTLIHSSNG